MRLAMEFYYTRMPLRLDRHHLQRRLHTIIKPGVGFYIYRRLVHASKAALGVFLRADFGRAAEFDDGEGVDDGAGQAAGAALALSLWTVDARVACARTVAFGVADGTDSLGMSIRVLGYV